MNLYEGKTIIVTGDSMSVFLAALSVKRMTGAEVTVLFPEETPYAFLKERNHPFIRTGSEDLLPRAEEFNRMVLSQMNEAGIRVETREKTCGLLVNSEFQVRGAATAAPDGIRIFRSDIVIDLSGRLQDTVFDEGKPATVHYGFDLTSEKKISERSLVLNTETGAACLCFHRNELPGKTTVELSFQKQVSEAELKHPDLLMPEVQARVTEAVQYLRKEDASVHLSEDKYPDTVYLTGCSFSGLDLPENYLVPDLSDLPDFSIEHLSDITERIRSAVSEVLQTTSFSSCMQEAASYRPEETTGNSEENPSHTDSALANRSEDCLLVGDILVPLSEGTECPDGTVRFRKRSFLKERNADVFLSGQGPLPDAIEQVLCEKGISCIRTGQHTLLCGAEADEETAVHAVLAAENGLYTVRAALFIDAEAESNLCRFLDAGFLSTDLLSSLAALQADASCHTGFWQAMTDRIYSYDDVVNETEYPDLLTAVRKNDTVYRIPMSGFFVKGYTNVMSLGGLFVPGLFAPCQFLANHALTASEAASSKEKSSSEAAFFEDELSDILSACGTAVGHLLALCIRHRKLLRELNPVTLKNTLLKEGIISEELLTPPEPKDIGQALNRAVAGDCSVLPLLFLHEQEIRDSAMFLYRLNPENEVLKRLASWCRDTDEYGPLS